MKIKDLFKADILFYSVFIKVAMQRIPIDAFYIFQNSGKPKYAEVLELIV